MAALRSPSRRRRVVRRVVVLGGLVAVVAAYRSRALARNEARFGYQPVTGPEPGVSTRE
jgi:hypothetical protein